ncbi:MAG: ATP synthase F1 subunit gamma [Candidatus Omnitrophica bacterium]|nr:ATP synthase F1 subunit gamma [Candidatus Omnitrophota bacterium]
MAESLKRIKNRIKSVQGVEKLTAAMKMISASKLKSFQKELALSNDYFSRVEAMLKNTLSSCNMPGNRFLQPRPAKGKIAVCVIASDRGLCGSYNNNILNYTQDFIRINAAKDIKLITVGGKALRYFKKRGFTPVDSYVDLYGRYSGQVKDDITKKLTSFFLNEEADEIYLAYTNFISGSRHRPVIEKILNIEVPKGEETEYITEPGFDGILERLIPLYLSEKIRHIILSAFTSEHAMRLMAMSEATDNAGELLEGLVLLRNKIRQASITTELIEVISSVSAMKG